MPSYFILLPLFFFFYDRINAGLFRKELELRVGERQGGFWGRMGQGGAGWGRMGQGGAGSSCVMKPDEAVFSFRELPCKCPL